MHKHIFGLLILGLCACMGWADTRPKSPADSGPDFDKYFNDSTLRLDMTFGAVPGSSPVILLDQMELSPGWHGRRHNLSSTPRQGKGAITLIDPLTTDTIYRQSFTTLFQEWLVTPEAQRVPRAFENVMLVPQPKAPVRVSVELFNPRRQVAASSSFTVDPSDILIARRDTTTHLPFRYLHGSPSRTDAIDVAILAEGYTPEQMDSFLVHAQTAVDAILSHEPFRSLDSCFNFIAVLSPSLQSGVSIPAANHWRHTAFGSHFSTFYSDRYLTSPHVKAMHDALRGIPYEHIIVLTNHDKYGGGGIYNAYTLTDAADKDFRKVVVHEFGHSFGGLTDEYFYDNADDVATDEYPLDVEPWEPNITTLVDFPSKWQSLLPSDTPVPTPIELKDEHPLGVFEGGGYLSKGVYRPVDQCIMRTLPNPFCPVCQKAIADLILFYVK